MYILVRLLFVFLLFFSSSRFPEARCQSETYPANFVWLDYHTHHVLKINYLSMAMNEDIVTLSIPIKRAGNLIILDAIIDSVYGNLILDSGSAGLVLNSIYFRHDRRSGTMLAGGVTGTTGMVSRSNIKNLQVSGLRFTELTADVTDLGHIEKARNIKVLGLFGLNLFTGYEVTIDLKNSHLELNRTDRRGDRIAKNALKTDHVIPVQISSDVVFLDAQIGGRKLTFCLDTGAESNVLGNHLPGRVLNTVSIYRRSSLRGVGAQSVEALYGTMNDFDLDGKKLEGMNTIITNLSAMSDSYGIRIDGMLGCDFLEKGIFRINLQKKVIEIKYHKEG